MKRHFKSPLYVNYSHLSKDTLILREEPYIGCCPFYAFEDGLFCPITWSI